MTLGSVSSSGRVQDALSGRPKVAIVTGASSGIGLEAVRRLVACGYRVVANSRNITSAHSLDGTGDLNTPMHPVETHEFLKQLSPFNRLAEVEEVADLLLYMECAPFLNGEVVHLDGGAHAGKW